MVAGLRRVLTIGAAVFCVALALPAFALAKGAPKCNASACKVYIEQGAPSGGKQQQQPPPPPTTSTTNAGGNQPQPTKLSRVLAHAGADEVPLSKALNDSGSGPLHGGSANVVGPSFLGAALDLGPGPLALLAVLLASAVGFAIYNGARNRRRERPSA